MKKIVKLPNRVLVKLFRESSGVFIAELPEYNLHTEADSVWGLIQNVNDILKLYFDIPENSLNKCTYVPESRDEPQTKKIVDMNFLKYLSPASCMCLQ